MVIIGRNLAQESVKIVALLTLVGISWWLLDQNRSAPSEGVSDDAQEPDAFIRDFVATTTDNAGRPQYRLEAQSMVHYPHNDTSEMEKPYLTLYREDELPWYVRAERGLIAPQGETVFLLGKVYMEHEDGRGRQLQVHTHDLEIYPDDQYAETDQKVTILHDLGTTHGIGLEAFLREGRLSLLTNVKGEYDPTPK